MGTSVLVPHKRCSHCKELKPSDAWQAAHNQCNADKADEWEVA